MYGAILLMTSINASIAGAYTCSLRTNGPFSEPVDVLVKKAGDRKASKGMGRQTDIKCYSENSDDRGRL